ncbi:hypothetical protein V5O48_004875 [Marasmius crinis-equi]|uniref:Uncharacterized protein n=1 Tax=Marasmius crinis-equi TaxID=585013 RepID=A0ABR3FNZ0_9AGAR
MSGKKTESTTSQSLGGKTESTTSLIPKDSKVSSEPESTTVANKEDSNKDKSSSTNTVPTSFADFEKKSKEQGWAAPTPTKPNFNI